MSTQNINKRILFNINWDLDTNGVRKLELDAIKCQNSNINAVATINNPIDGTTTKADATLFFARNRLIHLMDSWNHVLNSGLFLEGRFSSAQPNSYYKIIGSNVRSTLAEYLFKNWNISGTYHYKLDFKTESIFYRMVRFLVACVNNHNWFVANNISKSSYFNLTGVNVFYDMVSYINTNFNPTSAKFLATIEGFLGILKELISESNLVSKLGITLDSLTYLTPEGRTNIMALDGYKSNYQALAKIELDYLNPEPKALAQEWIQGSSSNVKLLWPQFGTLINRNITGPGEEAWSFRNVLVDTSDYDQFAVDPLMDPLLKKYQPRYIACSQVDMKKPLVFGTQFINWSNENDQPYVMSYNGGTLINLPDTIKDPDTNGTPGEQPDNQLNLAANFWSIGTSNDLDPNYKPTDDIKLKSIPDLHNLDKLDYLDNLTLYLKLN